MWAIERPRTGAGTSAQAGWACRAALAAATNVLASPSETSATTSLVRAGLVDAIRAPVAPATGVPAMIEVMLRLITTSVRQCRRLRAAADVAGGGLVIRRGQRRSFIAGGGQPAERVVDGTHTNLQFVR